jgi:hypothetical protein
MDVADESSDRHQEEKSPKEQFSPLNRGDNAVCSSSLIRRSLISSGVDRARTPYKRAFRW